MARLDRYVLRHFWPPFVGTLLTALLLLLANRLLRILPWLLEIELPWGHVVPVFGWLLPSFLLFAMPIAAWVGWVVAFARLGGAHELTAMAGVGRAPARVLAPVLAISLCLWASAVWIAADHYGQGRWQFQQQMAALLRTAVVAGLQPGATAQLGDLTLGMGPPPAPGAAGQIFVEQAPDTFMIAATATPLTDRIGIELREGRGFVRDATDPTFFDFQLARIYLDDEQFPPPRRGMGERPFAELRRRSGHYRYATELHSRLALGAGLLVAPLMAFVLAPRRRRSGTGSALVTGVVGLTVYWSLFTLGKQLAAGNKLPAAPAVWAANAVGILLAAVWLARKHRRPGLP